MGVRRNHGLTLSALEAVGLARVRMTAWPVLLASNPYTVAVGLFSLQEQPQQSFYSAFILSYRGVFSTLHCIAMSATRLGNTLLINLMMIWKTFSRVKSPLHTYS